MTPQEYISSGLLELYVLQQLDDPAEQRNIDQLRLTEPLIAAEIEQIERDLYRYAQQFEQQPPAHVKQQLMQQIAASITTTTTNDPSSATHNNAHTTKQAQHNTPVRSLPNYRAVAAACAVLFLASSMVAAYFYAENGKAQQQLNALRQRSDTLTTQMALMGEDMGMLRDPNFRKIVMSKVKPDAKFMSAIVYFNPSNNQLYLMIDNLPKPPADKQYQLWALVGGKPVDAGVFDPATHLIQMKRMTAQASTLQPEAFAVTLEPRGGKPEPTMETLIILGKN